MTLAETVDMKTIFEKFREWLNRPAEASFAEPACCAAPPEMSEQEFDEIMERTNQACIAKYGKTVCELIEEGEAESAQHNS